MNFSTIVLTLAGLWVLWHFRVIILAYAKRLEAEAEAHLAASNLNNAQVEVVSQSADMARDQQAEVAAARAARDAAVAKQNAEADRLAAAVSGDAIPATLQP